MNDSLIIDYQLQHYLQTEIEKLPPSQQIQLKNLRLCGKKIIVPSNGEAGVFVMSNSEESAYFGHTSCKNPFACPVCSAHRMSGVAREIATAIEVLRDKGYFGFMVSLTIPHLKFMSCREITNELYETYSYFRRTMKQKNYRKRTDGTLGYRAGTVSRQFFNDVPIEHSVTICEYTWGKNGWHPHFHAIWWTKRENKDKILSWEKALNEFWLTTAERIQRKYHDPKTIKNLHKYAEKDSGLVFSRDGDKIGESKSSDYIAGWGGDKELTGNYRKEATAKDHYTPYQLLQKAYEGDKNARALYIEFALATTLKPVHHRVIWSRTGLKAIIQLAATQERYREYIKKKSTESWRVIIWFTTDDWKSILRKENEMKSPIRANILYLAKKDKALLTDYLSAIGVTYRNPQEHYFSDLIAEIFNAA